MDKSSFSVEKPEDSPGLLLWQTTIRWQRLIKKALDDYDISHAQFLILAVLLWCKETNQKPIQSYLVNQTKLDKMTVSSTLKKLGAQQLIIRDEHLTDTRAKSVSLTKKGQSLAKKLVPIVEKIDKDFFSAINASHSKKFIQLLRCLSSDE